MDAKHIASFVHSSRLILFAAIVVSCSVLEKDDVREERECSVFYASFEQPSEVDGTRVTVREDLKVVWDQGDLISLFNKKDANEEYRFTGKTGDNGGTFELVKDFSEEGVARDDIHAVYPYSPSTSIDTKGTLSVTLPAEQNYKSHSFGQGANLMAAVSKDKNLQFRNACGYLCVQLFGRDISVSSITLKGNNGEKIAGKATITMPMNGVPTVTMDSDATTEITLICKTPVQLGATAEKCTPFWFVVPPMSFSKGFTITVTEIKGGSFEKSTSKSLEIERNKLSRMSPIEVDPMPQPNNIIYYTSTDGIIITPNVFDFGVTIVSNEYINGRGIITFDSDITRIGLFAFLGCSSLVGISIPKGVTSIGVSAFYDCSSLMDITLPENLTSIDDAAFYGCSSLTSIEIPESVEEIGSGVFSKCTSLTSFSGKYASPDGRFLYDSGTIITVARGAFGSRVDIPDGTISIGSTAFEGFSGLTSISFPESLVSIGSYAFYDCSGLTDITFPDNLTSIGESAFYNCTGLTTIKFPDSLTSIGNKAFYECKNLNSISLPDGLKDIRAYTFYGCTNLASISLPKNLNSIGDFAFEFLPHLTKITFPDGLTSIGRGTFAECTALSSIDLPNSLTNVGKAAFTGCNSITSVVFPDGMTSIPSSFSGCTGLTNIVLPANCKALDEGAFSGCTGLTSITLPDGITSIGGNAFYGCSGLSSITLSNRLTSIGALAFYGCSNLTSITVPGSLTSIGILPFWGCTGLESITFLSIEPPTTGGEGTLFNTNDDYPIYVPAGSVEAYKSAEGWSLHADRIQAIPE